MIHEKRLNTKASSICRIARPAVTFLRSLCLIENFPGAKTPSLDVQRAKRICCSSSQLSSGDSEARIPSRSSAIFALSPIFSFAVMTPADMASIQNNFDLPFLLPAGLSSPVPSNVHCTPQYAASILRSSSCAKCRVLPGYAGCSQPKNRLELRGKSRHVRHTFGPSARMIGTFCENVPGSTECELKEIDAAHLEGVSMASLNQSLRRHIPAGPSLMRLYKSLLESMQT